MMTPPTFASIRARLSWVLGGLGLWVLALVFVPPVLAGDRLDPETFILTGPDVETPDTTADFTFQSTARRAAFYCLLDGDFTSEFVPCDTPWHVEELELGEHVLWVYSVDLDTELPDPSPAMWEWTVVEGPPLDAGTPDAGAPDGGPTGDTDGGTSDAGSGGNDGGTSGGEDAGTFDAGSPGNDDAGTGDAGTPDEDAGTGDPSDAGTPGEDAGTQDAGTPGGGADGGNGQPGPPPSEDSVPPEALDYMGAGVGCTGAPAPGALAGLLLLAWALRRRGRR